MTEYKNLTEWLESRGDPKCAVSEGENGEMIAVVDDRKSLDFGITIYGFREYQDDTHKWLWISSGLGLRKDYFPALKKFFDEIVGEDENSLSGDKE